MYLEQFTEFQRLSQGHAPRWLRKLREDAFALFCETGFPTTHDEDWRFTNVAAIARTPFALPPKNATPLVGSVLQPWLMKDVAVELVFVDGQFARELSVLPSLPGVTVSSLRQAFMNRSEALQTHLGRY